MNAVRAGIGHNHAPMRIGRDAVGVHQKVKVRLARDHVDHASPEAALRLYLALQAKAAFKRELPAAVEQQLRGRMLANCRLRLFRGGCRNGEQCDQAGSDPRSPQWAPTASAQKKSNHRDTPMKYEFAVPGGVPRALMLWLNLVNPASTPILRKWYCI